MYKGDITNKKYLENVLEVLKEVEFAGTYEEPYGSCPMCTGFADVGHDSGCKLAKLIKHTEEMLK